ncbi:hypothetical protein [Fulvivirga ligni]|uniref:hypothetical protein n=1 Tax=Fulvivirga ligni TaxID=2904246 RepID=UPI001F3025BC|nr:hypothetical protein [Fulvivirga ligni]UII19105.1 hypothetical protein LVD16_14770 [Fulvivirga ligni]
MSQVNIIFSAILLSIISCTENDTIDKPDLAGKWDLQIKRGDDFLWNYEQGFELLSNGSYLPRYWNEDNSSWQSEDQEFGTLTWKLLEKNKENRLYFYHEYSLFNDNKKDIVSYSIISIQSDFLQLSGYDPHGNKRELTMIKEK